MGSGYIVYDELFIMKLLKSLIIEDIKEKTAFYTYFEDIGFEKIFNLKGIMLIWDKSVI